MSRIDEIKKEINRIEQADFMLQMKDHWSNSDYETSNKYREEVRALEKELEKLEEQS